MPVIPIHTQHEQPVVILGGITASLAAALLQKFQFPVHESRLPLFESQASKIVGANIRQGTYEVLVRDKMIPVNADANTFLWGAEEKDARVYGRMRPIDQTSSAIYILDNFRFYGVDIVRGGAIVFDHNNKWTATAMAREEFFKKYLLPNGESLSLENVPSTRLIALDNFPHKYSAMKSSIETLFGASPRVQLVTSEFYAEAIKKLDDEKAKPSPL